MRAILLSVLAGLLFPFISCGQSLDEVIKVGNQSFDTKDYYNAFRCYERVLGFVEKGKYKGDWDPLYIKYRYAESAQRFNHFKKADTIYTELLSESLNANMDVYARSTFNLGRVKQSLAKDTIALNLIRLDTNMLRKAWEYYDAFLSKGLSQHLRSFPAQVKKNLDSSPLSEPARLDFETAAKKGKADCARAIEAAGRHPQGFALSEDTLSRLPGTVNSRYSDIAPVLIGNTLYFSSVKFPSGPEKLQRQSRIYSQVLKAGYLQNDQGVPKAILEVDTLPQAGFFNDGSDFSHTIHTAITNNGEWMYFSHCPQGRGEDPRCTLYRRKKTDGGWGVPEYLDINVDSTQFTTTQPSISYDFRTKEQWLYFASDRNGPGTKGKLDIWRCRVDEADGSLAAPEPFSAANSEWNDATPFLHALSGRLFFSSDRESTFGLYDNFVWIPAKTGGVVENLGLPYNSGYNDQYYFLAGEGDRAFFSSDRPESTRFVDSLDACCQDIYTYPIDLRAELSVEICGCGRNLAEEARLEIYDITYCDCEEESNRVSIENLKKYHKYRLVASHEDFVANRDVVVYFDGSHDGKLDTVVSLSPAYVDYRFVVRDSSTREPLGTEEYTLTLAAEGAPSPERPDYQTYRLNPQYNYTLEVTAKNPAYPPKKQLLNLAPIRTTGCEARCDTTYYVDLAIPCLPDSLEGIIFYFDNDKPSRIERRKWTTTNERFNSALVGPYYAKKDKYMKFNLDQIPVTWSKVATQVRFDTILDFDDRIERIDTLLDLKTPAEQEGVETESLRYFVRRAGSGQFNIIPDPVTVGGRIERFFDRDLQGNLDKFNNFIAYLKNYLETGNDIRITMQAYCSKRVSGTVSNYNDSLAVRRIRCIDATIRESLEKSWAGVNGTERDNYGDFIIDPKPVGDSEAAENFPDPDLDPDDDEGGEFFLSAALDRRVEITSIEIKTCDGGEAFSSDNTIKNPGQP